MSKTARVKVPEVTAALLTSLNDAARLQIELELTVNSDLSHCAAPGPVLGEALERSIGCAFETMAAPEVKERRLEIIFLESEKKYTCRLLFPESKPADPDLFENGLAPVGELLNPHGGRVNLAVANNGIEIFLTVPRKEV
jgi:hypothetical protein